MIEKRGQFLIVGSHEWAWSRRTSGFPVFAVIKTESGYLVEQIGETTKRFTKYFLPEGTVAVITKYVTNRWNRRYYVYCFDGDSIAEYTFDEREDFAVPDTDSEAHLKILEFIRNWILETEV